MAKQQSADDIEFDELMARYKKEQTPQVQQRTIVEDSPIANLVSLPLQDLANDDGSNSFPKSDAAQYQAGNSNNTLIKQQASVDESKLANEAAKAKVENLAKAMLEDSAKEKAAAEASIDAPIDIQSKAARDSYNARVDALGKSKDDNGMADIIIALMPGVLGLLSGNNAGKHAAADTQKTVNDLINKRKDIYQKSVSNQRESLAKESSGIAEMQKAEGAKLADNRKFGMDRNRLSFDMTKEVANLYKNGQIKEAEALAAEKRSLFGDTHKAIDKTVQAELKVDNMADQKDIAKMGAEQRLESSKYNAQAADKRAGMARANRPPTEGMVKSAETYAAMTKADQSIDRMLKSNNGKWPSTSSKTFGYLKNSFESNNDLKMGAILQQIPNVLERRQIQSELDWLAPKLRKDSGAAISVGEYLSEANRYFPRDGDNKAIISEKDASRKQALENYKTNVGTAIIPKIIQPSAEASGGADLSREEKIKKLKYLESLGKGK